MRFARHRQPCRLRTVFVAVFGALFLTFGVPGAVAQIPGPVHDSIETISIELWSIDDSIIHGDTSPEERLLREAQYSISGMLYGWSFRYVPGSRARRVEQEWEIQPHANIPWGDPALTVRETAASENRIYGLVDYELTEEDQARQEAWRGVRTSRSSGTGTADLMEGTAGKLASIEEAIRDAVDRHLREVVPNRPREVWGDIMLAEPPRIRPVAGRYESRVSVLIRIEAVRPYLAY